MSTFTSEHPGVAHGPKSMGAPSIHYNVAIGYLRAFVTPLVLAHHAVLAYHPYPPARGQRWSSNRAGGRRFPWSMRTTGWHGPSSPLPWRLLHVADVFPVRPVRLPQHRTQGLSTFLRDRLLRLGLPFAIAAAVISPVAYYPAYSMTASPSGIVGYWQPWRALGTWPAAQRGSSGCLLTFDVVAGGLFALATKVVD